MKTSITVPRMVREWARFAFLTFVLFLGIRIFVLEAYSIPTSSMEETLMVGDFLLVNKMLFGAEVPATEIRFPSFRDPERGDVVVFKPPHDPLRNYVKRVVGLPGDTLEMLDKILYLNGVALTEDYARHVDRRGDAVHPDMAWQSDHLVAAGPSEPYSPSRDHWGPLVVPPEEYFVLGDNRDNSEDSRYWGFVGRWDIKGSPWVVYLSMENQEAEASLLKRVRWGRFGHRVR